MKLDLVFKLFTMLNSSDFTKLAKSLCGVRPLFALVATVDSAVVVVRAADASVAVPTVAAALVSLAVDAADCVVCSDEAGV